MNCTKFKMRLGPALPRPYLVEAVFKGATSKGKEGERSGREEERAQKGRGNGMLVTLSPLELRSGYAPDHQVWCT